MKHLICRILGQDFYGCSGHSLEKLGTMHALAIGTTPSDGEPGGILSLGFLTQSTQATKLKSNFHSFQKLPITIPVLALNRPTSTERSHYNRYGTKRKLPNK